MSLFEKLKIILYLVAHALAVSVGVIIFVPLAVAGWLLMIVTCLFVILYFACQPRSYNPIPPYLCAWEEDE